MFSEVACLLVLFTAHCCISLQCFLYQSHRVIRGAQRAESLMLSDSKDLGLNHPNHAPTKADFHTCNLAPTRFFTRTIIGQEMGIQKATKSAFMDL